MNKQQQCEETSTVCRQSLCGGCSGLRVGGLNLALPGCGTDLRPNMSSVMPKSSSAGQSFRKHLLYLLYEDTVIGKNTSTNSLAFYLGLPAPKRCAEEKKKTGTMSPGRLFMVLHNGAENGLPFLTAA